MNMRKKYGHSNNGHNNSNNSGGGGNPRRRKYSGQRDGGHGHSRGRQSSMQPADDSGHINPRQRQHAKSQREKYISMARDAASSGDRVQSEYYLQCADHYSRILIAAQEQYEARRQQDGYQDSGMDDEDADGGADGQVDAMPYDEEERPQRRYGHARTDDGHDADGFDQEGYAPRQRQSRGRSNEEGQERGPRRRGRPPRARYEPKPAGDGNAGDAADSSSLRDILPAPKEASH